MNQITTKQFSDKPDNAPCPCGTGKLYYTCCGAYIGGLRTPETPEALMRSRYTAYTEANIAYIIQTMKSPAADGFDPSEAATWAKTVKWISLEVIRARQENTTGYVEFIARFEDQQMPQALHELSEFLLIDGAWFYVSGQAPTKR
tara:strand:+ start:76 stop:510 length:435 start_codon:yes stop_codon:yes gene_type:complete